MCVLDVSFGSLADILRCPRHVRFTPESGHLQCTSVCPLSAHSGHRDVKFKPVHLCELKIRTCIGMPPDGPFREYANAEG